MKNQKRYNDHATFFKKEFRERVQKLSIDAGFTCPNRDGSRGIGGCTFCNNRSFNPEYCRSTLSISQQIEAGKQFFAHKYVGQKYLAYFQAYSNTYAPLEELQRKYEEALACQDVVGLVIGTRPDAINQETLDYIQKLSQKHYVCVEYGVESTNDAVLQNINRGHSFAEVEQAIKWTAERAIRIGVHLIFGLPGETADEMLQGAIRLCELPIDVLKLHQLQIVRGTQMAKEYESDPSHFQLYTLEDYLNFVVDVIESIRPEIYLERFVNQSPEEYLIAPKWGVKNYEFVAKLDKRLQERDSWQGKKYKKNNYI